MRHIISWKFTDVSEELTAFIISVSMFILEHLFSGVCEAFSSSYPDVEVPNNTPTGKNFGAQKG
jgi:hypothetical protein